MKKNLINAALLGVLVLGTSASSFVSCKDYDEQISSLEQQVKADKQDLADAKAAFAAQVQELMAKQAANTEAINKLTADYKTADEALKATIEAKAQECAAKAAQLQAAIDALKEVDTKLQALIDGKVDKAVYDVAIADINSKIAALQTGLNKVGVDLNAVSVKAQEALTKAEAAATEAAEAKNEVEKLRNELKNKADFQLAALEAYKAEMNAKLAGILTSDALDELKVQVIANATEIMLLKGQLMNFATKAELEAVKAQFAALNQKVAKIDARLAVLEAVGGLKSLVLEPESYYRGIEAIEGDSYDFLSWNVNKNKTDDGKAILYQADPTNDAGAANITPAVTATYHVNPTNATLKETPENYKFFVLNRVNRAGGELITPVVTSAKQADGKVTVGFKVGDNDKNRTGVGNEVTVLALNYSDGGVSVTSDYAVLYTSKYTNLELHNAAIERGAGTTEAALSTTLNGAATIDLAYNDTLDLKKWVNTYRLGDALVRWDKNAAEGLVEKSGFKYEFEVVANGTADEAYKYITIDANGKVTAHMPNSTTQSISTVGQAPYVRVVLRYADGQVAAVGFYQLVITGEGNWQEVLPANTAEYTMVCAPTDQVFKGVFALTPEVLADIKSKTTYDEATFWTKYAVAETAGVVDQYTFDAANNTYTQAQQGVVTVDANAKKITWTLTEADKNLVNGEQSTWVKFFNAENASNFYVKLTWKPAKINNTPEVAFNLNKRTPEYWFNNQNVAGEKEIRMHVNLSNTDKFAYDLNDAFIGNKPEVSALVAPYNNLGPVEGKFVFLTPRVKEVQGTDGKTYVLSINTDGSALNATVKGGTQATQIATLDGATGVLTLTDKDNVVLKALLNYRGHNQLADGQTLTARVGYAVTVCGNKPVKVTGSEFDVKFLRPIDVVGSVNVPGVDATLPVIETPAKFTFEDWRDYKFAAHPELYTLYGVQAITAEPKETWTTTLGGNTLADNVTLVSVNKNVELEYVAPTTAIGEDNWGVVRYTTPDNVLQNFTVRIPVKVTYKWGDVVTYMDVNIGRTINNTRKK